MLLGGNSVEAGVGSNPAGGTYRDERSVILNGEDSNRSDLGIQGVEELAIAADGDVQVRCTGGIVSDNGAWQRRQ